MKRALPPLAAAGLLALSSDFASAEDHYVPANSATLNLRAALGKQIDVRFSEGFAKDRLPAREIAGVIVYETTSDSICLYGEGKGLEPGSPGLAPLSRAPGGEVCIPAAEVSVRVPRAGADGRTVPFYSTDKQNCSWQWKEGRGIGLWTEQCSFDSGVWDVVYDPGKDVFSLRVNAGEPYAVLRQFRAEGAPALLADLKAQGLVLDDPECVMAEVPGLPVPPGWTAYQVVPTGKRKEAFDAVVQIEVPEPPCGELGYTVDALSFFMVDGSHPGRVLFANLGQDGTMIDLASITLTD
ncbi:hypothetical protein [Aestuariivirga sp.]|uniref:hypothetical protein n=1 Tax=Aestuariivirga sp. TaxID=2650926 RepID=UPI00391BD4C1